MPSRLSEHAGLVFIIKPEDYGSAGADGDSFHMKNHRRATVLLAFSDLTGDSILKVYSGATDAVKTTAETFKYRLSGVDQGSAGADQFGDRTSSAALTLTAATYADRLLAVEIDASELTAGQPWVTVEIDSTATVLDVAGVAVLEDGRYSADDVPTAIA